MEMTNREILERAKTMMKSFDDSEQVLEAKSMLEGISGYENADSLIAECDEILTAFGKRDECLTEILDLSNSILKNGNVVKIMKIACIVFGAIIVLAALPIIISGAAMNSQVLIFVGIIIGIVGFFGLIVGVLISLMKTNVILALIADKRVLEKDSKQIYGQLTELGYIDNEFNY